MHRKTVADTFWIAKLEEEMRQRGWIDRVFKDPSDREKLMQEIDTIRATTMYSHLVCSEECKKRDTMCGKCELLITLLMPSCESYRVWKGLLD